MDYTDTERMDRQITRLGVKHFTTTFTTGDQIYISEVRFVVDDATIGTYAGNVSMKRRSEQGIGGEHEVHFEFTARVNPDIRKSVAFSNHVSWRAYKSKDAVTAFQSNISSPDDPLLIDRFGVIQGIAKYMEDAAQIEGQKIS